MKRPIFLFNLLLILGLMLSACAMPVTAPAAAPGEQPAPAAQKVTIRLATWAGVDESAELQVLLDEINSEQDRFEIVHEPAPADYYTKIQTALAGGTSADLFWLSQEWIAGMAAQGALLDITDFLAGDTTHPAANLDDYFPDILKTAQYQGRTYGLPWIAQPVVLYFNRALFDAAGVDYPTADWTWDDFVAAAAALTKDLDGDGKNDQWGFTMNGWPPPQMFVWQAGGEVITADLSASPIDTPEAIAGFQFYADLIFDDVHTPPEAVIQEQGFGEMFKAGKIAMFMGGAADDLDRVPGLDVGVVRVPAGPAGRPTFAWTASTVIAAQTQNPELAYEALARLTEKIHGWKIVAPRKSLANIEALVAAEPRKEKNAAAIVEAIPDMRAFNIIPRHQEWDTIFWGDFMDPLFHDQGTAAELAPKIRPLLEELLP